MPVGVLVDPEGAVRDWARSRAAITTLAAGGVHLELPRGAVFPLLQVPGRVGGATNALIAEDPLDSPVITFNAWGNTRKEAADLAYAVANQAQATADPTPMGALVGKAATVVAGPLYDPDPRSGRPRYVVDVQFVLRSA